MNEVTPSSSQKTVIISVANQKGGVGKTTTAVNLAAGLAMANYKVLLLDIDIQANATHILAQPLREGDKGLAEVVMEEATLDEVIVKSSTENLLVGPSGETMAKVDLVLATMLGREEALERVILASNIAQEQDFIIIDTSPYLGLLTVNALVASHKLIIPVSCEYLPMLGLRLFLSTVNTVQNRLNQSLEVLGYLLTMYDRREKISFDVENLMKKNFGESVFPKPIRINTKHKSSPAYRQTIFQFEGENGRGAEDYRRFTNDVLSRLHLPPKKQD